MDCAVQTDVASNVFVKFGPDTGGGCQEPRSTAVSFGSSTGVTSHTVTLYGMRASTAIDWRVYANDGGTGTATSSCGNTTSGALVAGTNGLDKIVVTASPTTNPGSTNNLLTHYGCGGATDAFVVLDRTGAVVWYQDPSADLGLSPSTTEAMSLSRPSKHILGIVDHRYIVEYDLAGNLVHFLCKDDGTGACDDPTSTLTATPDALFDEFVHHDVQLLPGGKMWALYATTESVTDELDCDADGSATDNYPIIVDGLYDIDVSGSTVSVTDRWRWTDDPAVTIDYSVAPCPGATVDACSRGYWTGYMPGCDYMHTNSLWIDVSDTWMLSSHNLSTVSLVDGDTASSTFGTVLTEVKGDGTGDLAFTSGGLTEDFSGQHSAHWDPDGDLLIFDNQWGSGGSFGDARGVSYTMTSTDLTADVEFVMQDLSANPVSCAVGSSAYSMLSGNVLVTCSEVLGGNKALVNEFDSTGAVVWTAELSCTTGAPHGVAFRGYPNVW